MDVSNRKSKHSTNRYTLKVFLCFFSENIGLNITISTHPAQNRNWKTKTNLNQILSICFWLFGNDRNNLNQNEYFSSHTNKERKKDRRKNNKVGVFNGCNDAKMAIKQKQKSIPGHGWDSLYICLCVSKQLLFSNYPN